MVMVMVMVMVPHKKRSRAIQITIQPSVVMVLVLETSTISIAHSVFSSFAWSLLSSYAKRSLSWPCVAPTNTDVPRQAGTK